MAKPNDTPAAALKKRKPLHSASFRRRHPAARAFLAPQRTRPAKAVYPKPAA